MGRDLLEQVVVGVARFGNRGGSVKGLASGLIEREYLHVDTSTIHCGDPSVAEIQ